MTKRLDRLIADIRSKVHSKVIREEAEKDCDGDVLLVAHGHILRAFAIRWTGRPLTDRVPLILEGEQPEVSGNASLTIYSWWCWHVEVR